MYRHSEENVPMSEQIPVRAEVGGLPELLLLHRRQLRRDPVLR